MRFIPVIILTALAFLALVLTQAATFQSPNLAEGWFVPLLIADGILILVILIAVVLMAYRIGAAWRRGAPGGRLALRLGGVLLAVALLPSVLLYGISAAGIFRSIDSWFATPLGRAFEQGEAFGKSVLEGEFASLETVARDMANNLRGRDGLPFWVEDFRLFHQLDGVALYDGEGRALATSGEEADGRLSGTSRFAASGMPTAGGRQKCLRRQICWRVCAQEYTICASHQPFTIVIANLASVSCSLDGNFPASLRPNLSAPI